MATVLAVAFTAETRLIAVVSAAEVDACTVGVPVTLILVFRLDTVPAAAVLLAAKLTEVVSAAETTADAVGAAEKPEGTAVRAAVAVASDVVLVVSVIAVSSAATAVADPTG